MGLKWVTIVFAIALLSSGCCPKIVETVHDRDTVVVIKEVEKTATVKDSSSASVNVDSLLKIILSIKSSDQPGKDTVVIWKTVSNGVSALLYYNVHEQKVALEARVDSLLRIKVPEKTTTIKETTVQTVEKCTSRWHSFLNKWFWFCVAIVGGGITFALLKK